MSDIKRYQPYADYAMGKWFAAAKEDPEGGWVTYLDHAAELAALREAVRVLGHFSNLGHALMGLGGEDYDLVYGDAEDAWDAIESNPIASAAASGTSTP